MLMNLPQDIYVYQVDEANGQPVYAIASTVDDIPEDCDGSTVATYHFVRDGMFKVKRELK